MGKFWYVSTKKLNCFVTTFPGDYGAGKTIKTFFLLPKEETEISIKTWKKTKEETKKASSILDSYTDEKADEFENSIHSESSSSSKVIKATSFSIEADVHAKWGFGSVDVGVDYNDSINTSREGISKNVMNATEKHAQSASAKREINIDTSYEKSVEEEEEIVIMRKIANLNASRTLNFTFRQMNQQYHSLLHLTNVRIAFYNGIPGSMKEYPLNKLNYFITKYMDDQKKIAALELLKSILL